MELIESKSILAKLMATENLTVEQKAVSTACFDVKNRILTVPILDRNISSALYDLFMGHEVGHALYTPLEEIREAYEERKIPASLLNVVEDSRIERKIKHKFPGLRNSFVKGYKELMDKDFFGTAGADLNEFNLIDRINLYCKGGPTQGIKFNDIEKELLDEVESTETYQDVVNVAEKIMKYMKEREQERKEEEEKFKKAENDEDGEEFEEFEEDDFDDFEDSDENDEEFEQEILENQKKLKNDESIKSFTDEIYKQNEKQLFDEKSRNYSYGNIPKVDIEKAIFDYKELYDLYRKGDTSWNEPYVIGKEAYLKLRTELSKVVSYLVKEFELRKNADQLKRASTAKTGDLNMSKIFSYKFNEDIFKKITVVPGGKSHGLILFLDWSGSMTHHLGSTVKQLLSLVLFCKKVNIPYEVYAFSSNTTNEHTYSIEPKEGDLALGSFTLINVLSSRMSTADFTYGASVLCAVSGLGRDNIHDAFRSPWWLRLQSTPLNQSIIAAMEIVPKFQKKYKLQVVNTVFLTDGESDCIDGIWSLTKNYNGDCRLTEHNEHRQNTIVIRDPITKHQEVIKDNRNDTTNALLRLLKVRTNCNTIGFYILANREFVKNSNRFFQSMTQANDAMINFRKNKYCIIPSSKSSGYDDYYLLKSNGNAIDDADEKFEVKGNTTRGLVSAFTKYTGNRVGNRVVLNRFIGLIT